jgi:DNA-binding transcriptional MerR regulator/anti-sigma regulatory factor (Ser/Thr protein kinase)
LQTTTAALSRATTPGAVLDVAAAHAEGLGGVAVVVPRGARLDAVVVRGPDARPDAEALARAARDAVPVWAGVPHAVPLLVEGRAVAVLGLWPERPLDDEDRAALLSAVEQCALAYDRARLTEAEREVAEVLQRSLLPARAARRRPARRRLALHPGRGAHPRRRGLVRDAAGGGHPRRARAGDVVGHGPTAAAVMGSCAARSPPPSSTAAARRRAGAPGRLRRPRRGSTGSTCACLVLDWATGDLTWALAGHPPVLLLDEDGAQLLDDPAALGAVLGVRPRPPYRQVTRRLAPGSSLVLYTDGLVERRGEGLDDGLERLLAVAGGLTGDGPGAAVAGLVDGLLTSAGPADDVALLVVRLVPEPLEVELPAVARSMARLRRVVERWGTDAGLAGEPLDDLHLVLGEAAANAAEHAYPDEPGDVRCSLARERDGAVRFTVRDGGRWRPVPVDNGHRGHGLRVMQQLSEGFRVERGPEGTTVSGRLLPAAQVPPPPAAAAGCAGPGDSPVVVEERRDGAGRAVLALRGDLDLAGRSAVAAALARAGRGAVLDLTGCATSAAPGWRCSPAPRTSRCGWPRGSAPARVLALTGSTPLSTSTWSPRVDPRPGRGGRFCGVESIGATARASGLTVSALRFYDGAGVLAPAHVDPRTGYRSYAPDQVAVARLVAVLRRTGMPLAAIREVVAHRHDRTRVAALLSAHLRELERGVVDARRLLAGVPSLLEESPMTTSPSPCVLTDLPRVLRAVRFATGTDPAFPCSRACCSTSRREA